MKLREFTHIAEHIQSYLAEPLNVCDVSLLGLMLTTKSLEISADETADGVRYKICATVDATGDTFPNALKKLRDQFEKAIKPQTAQPATTEETENGND